MHYTLAVEEELRDVGEGGGVASGDAVMGELGEEIREEMVDVGWGGESVRAG